MQANLTTLINCFEEMSRKFFQDISEPSSCLHHLFSTTTTTTHLMAFFRDYPGKPVPER